MLLSSSGGLTNSANLGLDDEAVQAMTPPLAKPPGPALENVGLPRAPSFPSADGRLANSIPLGADDPTLFDQLNKGVRSLRATLLSEVDGLQKLLQQKRLKGNLASARWDGRPAAPMEVKMTSFCENSIHMQSPSLANNDEQPSTPSGRHVSPSERAFPQTPGRSFTELRSSIGSNPGIQSGDSESRFHQHPSVQPSPSRSAIFQGELAKSNTKLRTSNWSEYLYADDRAAQSAAKEKSAAEIMQNMQRLKASLHEPSWLKKVLEGTTFEVSMGLLIFANSILMGIELQYRTANSLEESPLGFSIGSHCFTMVFVLELLLRIWVYGVRELFCRYIFSWAWLDLIVVVTAVMEMTFDVMDSEGESSPSGFHGVNQVRMTRIMRMVRLVRALRIQRIIRFVSPLRTLVVSILGTLKSLVWAMALLVILIYIVALIISGSCLDWKLSEHPDAPDWVESQLLDYWISLDRAMFTLFQSFSGGISWRDATYSLEKVSLLLSWLVTAFVGFVMFALLNVMTGVFCSNAIETAQQNPEFVATSVITSRKAYSDNLRALFKTVDEDHSGLITLTELEKLLLDERMRAHLTALEIDVSDAWTLFRLLDSNHSGAIEVEEFLQGCEHLKGHAKGIDLATLNFEIKNLGKKLVKMSRTTEEQLEGLRRQLPVRI